MVIALEAGDWRMSVLPELGGAIGSLDFRGHPVLRSTPADATDPLQTACFPMVPWVNRIDHGRFKAGRSTINLRPTPGHEPHALHGEGWRVPWTPRDRTASSVVLDLTQPASSWPWAWSAQQRIWLDPAALHVNLYVTNNDRTMMPAGIGLHPYFARTVGDTLAFESTGVWATRPDGIPDRLAPPADIQDFSQAHALDDAPAVDHAYAGWNGRAVLTSGQGRIITLSAANARWLQVFAPADEPFFCLEPVTQRPDAHNAPMGEASGLLWLRPGETLWMEMVISAC